MIRHPSSRRTLLFLALPALAFSSALASVPLRFDIETSEARTRYLDVYRGETVAMELAFRSYGEPLAFADGTPATVYWQTNGMAAAWWTAPASAATNGLVSAAWGPAMDCGADRYSLFVGVGETSRMYRASFQVRLRGAPGYPANPLPLPVEVLDFNAVSYTNAPWALPSDIPEETDPTVPAWAKSETPPVTEETDPTVPAWAKADAPPVAEEVDPRAPGIVSNVVTKSYVEGLGISEVDPAFAAWLATNPPVVIDERDPVFQTWRDECEDTPWTLRNDINRVAGLVDDLPGAVAAATNAVFADVKSYVDGVGGSIELHIDRGLAGLEGTLKGEIAASTNEAIRHLSASMNTMEGLIYDNMINWDAETLAVATNYTDKALAEFGTAAYSNAVDFAPAALSEAAMLKSSPVAADANYNHDIYPLNEPVVQFASKTQVRVIGDTRFMVGANGVYLPTNMTVTVASALDTGTIAAGKDYCVCLDAQTNIIVSLASTATTNSAVRVLGGFHTICRSVPANYQEEPVSVFGGALHPLAGWTAGDILPASVWSLNFRPACDDPGGMVYCKEADIWVDIYNGSGSIYAPQSKFGGSRIHTKSQVAFMTGYANVGKVLLSDWEFFMAAVGSNCGSRLKGNVQPNPDTTGGHLDENDHPMISAIGCEEMCGLQVQWLRDNVGYATEQNLKWDNTASTGNPYYPTVAYDGGENSFGSFYAMGHYRAVFAGGSWASGSAVPCGPLYRVASFLRSSVGVSSGGRGSSRSTRTWTKP